MFLFVLSAFHEYTYNSIYYLHMSSMTCQYLPSTEVLPVVRAEPGCGVDVRGGIEFKPDGQEFLLLASGKKQQQIKFARNTNSLHYYKFKNVLDLDTSTHQLQ